VKTAKAGFAMQGPHLAEQRVHVAHVREPNRFALVQASLPREEVWEDVRRSSAHGSILDRNSRIGVCLFRRTV
jgi:hypothetical protein